jgi:hypothetical protein
MEQEMIVDSLSRYTPFAYSSAVGAVLVNGAIWDKCPDCDIDCAWLDGKPTAIHKGSKGE